MSQSGRSHILASVAVKFAFAVILTISAVVSALLYFFERDISNFANLMVFKQTVVQTELVGALLPPSVNIGQTTEIENLLKQYVDSSNGVFSNAVVLDASGQIIAQHGTDPAPELLDLGRSVIDTESAKIAADSPFAAYPLHLEAFGVRRPVGSIATTWTVSPVEIYMNNLQYRALGVATVVGLIAVFCAVFAFRGIVLSPLTSMRRNIASISNGELSVKIDAMGRKDEFGHFGRTLDELRSNLVKASEMQRDAMFKSEAFENSSAALVLADQNGQIFAINPAFEELAETHIKHFKQRFPSFNPSEMIGKPLDFFHPGDAKVKSKITNIGDSTFSTVIYMGDIRISLKINSILDGPDTQIGYVLEWQDVTEQWKNTSLINAIDAIQLLAEFSPEGKIEKANENFCSSIGQVHSDLNSLNLRDLLGNHSEKITQELKTNGAFIGKFTLKTNNGNAVVIEGSITSVPGANGNPYRVFLLGRNVTEVENAADEAQKELSILDQERVTVVEALKIGLKKLSEGDLLATLPNPFADRYEELRQDYNLAVERLCEAMGGISERAETIKHESQDISGTAETLSRRTESTAATLEQAAAALDALTSSVKTAAESSAKADIMVGDAKLNAEQSGKVVLKTVTAMDEIANSSEKVASIIKVIDDIAFQTNLLALNAGVEAARAGEAGRGFAVVASEVRALAQRSSEAASEINDLIAQSGAQVKVGVDLVGETGKALDRIVASVSEISLQVSEIAGSAKQQAFTLEEINASVNQLDQSTQQNAARLEETTAASDALRNEAVSLVETIGHFRFSNKVISNVQQKIAPTSQVKNNSGSQGVPHISKKENLLSDSGTWTDF